MEINKRQIKRLGRQKENLFSKAIAFLIIWGIIIPLIAAGVVASWTLLLGLINV